MRMITQSHTLLIEDEEIGHYPIADGKMSTVYLAKGITPVDVSG